MLPFEPESEAQLLARFPAALTPEYDVVELQARPETRPGLFRKHVFDFSDGIRMIASVDVCKTEGSALHLSFSLVAALRAVYPPMDYRRRVLAIIHQFTHLPPEHPAAYTQSPGGIDHFLFKLPICFVPPAA